MNANIDTYLSACYNVEICRSGEHGEIISRFPLGTGMKKNLILDSWLETIPFALAETCNNSQCGSPGASADRSVLMSLLTHGFIQIGKGITPTDISQRKLISYSKETNYIRPALNNASYTDYTGIGMRSFSRTYEFQPETSTNTYYEAGFRSSIFSPLWDANYYISGVFQQLPTNLRSPIFSRFVFSTPSGIVGFISGYKDEFGNLSTFDWRTGASGYIIDDQQYFFENNKLIPEKIIGFLSGYQDELGNFTGLHLLDSTSGSSGYYLNNNKYTFPTGDSFSGFDGQNGFDQINGYNFTGFEFVEGSGFSGTEFVDSGYGIMTGYIGSRNYIQPVLFSGFSGKNDFQYGWKVYDPFFSGITGGFSGIGGSATGSGIITGIIGYKNDLSGITVGPGEYIRIRYDVSMRIPAIVDPIPVTGNKLVYGDFNGSGSIKLLGSFGTLFGNMTSDGTVEETNTTGLGNNDTLKFNGIWWPMNITPFRSTDAGIGVHLTAGYVSGFSPLERITGFLSGYMDNFGRFTGLHLLDPESGSSGYYFSGAQYYFPTGTGFSGFSGQTGFYENENISFLYSGFTFPSGSGFSGIDYPNSGYGIMTGLIGYRTDLYVRDFSPINTGAGIPLISLGDSSRARLHPLSYNGTLLEYYGTGLDIRTKRNHYIDYELRFIAAYPNYDFNFCGLFISNSSSDAFFQPNVGTVISDGTPRSSNGWYWKFDSLQKKYLDQTLNVKFRFGVYRE